MSIIKFLKKIKYSIKGNYLGVWLNYLLNNQKQFKNELSIVAIVKNEAPYIKEWIEFHKLVGVEKFYIYDNESSDNLKEILSPYIKNGEVIYKFYPGKKMQLNAYKDAIRKYKNTTKWLGIIDLDEFIIPVKHNKITNVIREIQSTNPNKIAAISANWVTYGYSGHHEKPDGLVIKNFTKNAGPDKHVKVIVNPRTVVYINNPHYAVLYLFGLNQVNENNENFDGAFSNPSTEKIRINHYWTKSYSEFTQKIKRGFADGEGYRELPPYEPNYLSEFSDDIMDKYISYLETTARL